MTADRKIKKQDAARARKQQKNEKRKQKAQDYALICPPDAAGRSFKMRFFGYLCRIPVMFCAVVGIGTLLNTAFQISTTGAAVMPAILAVALLSLIMYGRWYTTLGGIVAGGGMLAWYVSQQSSLLTFLYGTVDVGVYRVCARLYRAGYYTYAKYQPTLTAMEEANQDMLAQTFVGLLTWLIALLFVPFLARRIRIVVPLITSVALIVPVFMFNMPVANWAVTAIIAGSCALLIMWGYQQRYDKDDKQDATSPLFSDLQRPELPERLRDLKQDKEQRKEQREERRERARRRNATGLVTVEEEINDYLDTSLAPRKKKKSETVSAAKLTDAEIAQRKAERAQVRAVHDYDRITKETRCAMGGIAGFCVMMLILIILLLPTLSVDGPFNTIDAIDHRVQYYREYVTATLRGNDPALEMYAYGESIRNEEPHSTTAETQTFEEIDLFRIYTQFKAPLYLQGWVGVDYTEGAWSSANDDQVFQWRELYDAADMPAEAMFEGFYQLMDPTGGVEITDPEDLRKKYYGYDEYGFVAFMVNIRRLRQMGAELYLPRVTSDTLRILDYQTVTPTEQPWAQYFDGVVVSSVMDEAVADYSVETFAPMQLNPEWYLNTSALIAAYNASAAEILRYEASRNKSSFRPDYLNTYVDGKDDERYSAAQDYIENMSYSDRAKVLSDIKDAQAYADFVYETYLDTSASEIIGNLAQKLYEETYPDECYQTVINEETGLLERTGLLPGAQPYNFALASMRDSRFTDTYTQRHLLTMAVINYLVENHEYSLEITTTGDPTLDGVENFLTVTKQGYCVQFASAAALLLRECGIPTRYMEGYVCSDFTRRVGASADYTRFAGEVRDSDKHAWIEVWFDGIGWVVYETTPPYYTELYGETSTTASTLAPTVADRDPINTPTPPVENPPEEELPPEQTPIDGEGGIDIKQLIKYILIVITVVVVLCAIVIAVVEFIRRGKRAQEKRTQLAQQIMRGDEAVFDSAEDREAAAKALIRNTLQLLALYGTAPQAGELRDDYAQRLSFSYEDMLGYPMEYDDGALGQREAVSRFRLGALLESVAAEEFGYGMSADDMKKLAELYLTLHEKRSMRISSAKRFTLRYFKHLI